MNRIGLVLQRVGLVAALLTAVPAYAQQRYDPAIPKGMPEQRYDPAIPRGMPEQRGEPAREITQTAPAPIPPRLVQNSRRAQRDADARQCLAMATNKDIHRCSLRYRSAASRAAVVKASAKPAAAPAASVELAKPADIGKSGPVRPGDAAKAADLVRPMDVTKGGTFKAADTTAKAPEPAKPAVPPPAATAPTKSPTPAPAAKAPEPAKK